MRLGEATCAGLLAAGLDPGDVERLVAAALVEDLGPAADSAADVTTRATVPDDLVSVADVVARASGVVAGLPVAAAVLDLVTHGRAHVSAYVKDGDRVSAGDVLMSVTGPTGALLTAERTLLNLLAQLSGVATLTARWVDAVTGTRAAVRDTRKTVPGLRGLQKYAVRCGGGRNHRMSLVDAALVKDNHVVAAGGVAEAFGLVRAEAPDLPIEVEADTVEQALEAVAAGANLVLLDNMPLEGLREAVSLVGGRARLEASGGLTLDNAAAVAATGVDYLAVGALTHSAPALDIGLDLRPAERRA